MQNTMKIWVLGPTYPFRGGIAHYTTLLVKSLREKYQVKFISFKHQYPSFLFPGKNQLDISKIPLKIKNEPIFNPYNPMTWFYIVTRAKKSIPDMFIFNWITPFFALQFLIIIYLLKQFTKIKILMICHNVKTHERMLGENILTKLTFGKVDYFIVHSKKGLKALKEIKPNAYIKKHPLPIYDFFKYKNISKDEAQKKINVSGKVILYFGFVRKYKGLIYLIQAMPLVLKEYDVNLLIVGEFWENKENYLKEIKKLNIIKKVQIIDKYIPNEDVNLYFSSADVVVLPYISATQSAIIQIAYGFDKPVISTKVGGIPEVVKNGIAGFVVPPENPKALARAIISFYKDNKGKEFIKNIKKEKKKFEWNKLVNAIEELVK